MRYASIAVLAIVLTACGSAPPPQVRAGDVCFRCKRVVTEAKLGVQMVTTSGQTSTFRTPGCLAKYLKDHSREAKEIYVTDYPTGEMIPVSRATFVGAKIDQETGERDFYAFGNVTEAVNLAKEVTGTVVDWSAVRSMVGSQKGD